MTTTAVLRLRSGHSDTRRIEHQLDYMLGFCSDPDMLRAYKRLCRHYFDIDPQTMYLPIGRCGMGRTPRRGRKKVVRGAELDGLIWVMLGGAGYDTANQTANAFGAPGVALR